MSQTQAFMSMLKQAQFLLIAVGAVMIHLGLDHGEAYKIITVAAGSGMVVGTAAWGLWSSYQNFRKASAIGVQAGINLTVSGKALAADGHTVVSENDGTTPPLPVTLASAAQIVSSFGPKPSDIQRV